MSTFQNSDDGRSTEITYVLYSDKFERTYLAKKHLELI